MGYRVLRKEKAMFNKPAPKWYEKNEVAYAIILGFVGVLIYGTVAGWFDDWHAYGYQCPPGTIEKGEYVGPNGRGVICENR